MTKKRPLWTRLKTQVFDPTKDLHTLDAARIFGVPVAEVTREQRYVAKELTFLDRLEPASRAGLGAARKAAGITDARMEKILADYHRAFPAARDLMKAKKP